MKKLILLAASIFSLSAHATFLPDDQIQPMALLNVGPSQTTEAEFQEMIAKAQEIYVPIAKELGGKLVINGDWKSNTINAYARQMFGTWQVSMLGGLARVPELSTDGLTLILCHEIGHHLGGFAFRSNGPIPIGTWAANEGQADYFATHVCLRKLWADQTDVNAMSMDMAREDMHRSCSKSWPQPQEHNLCLRILMASESVAHTMAKLRGETTLPRFNTPDRTQVTQTDHDHPATQCRMDTMLQGALCIAPFDDKIIPGKSVRGGRFSENAEKEAARVSCTAFSSHQVGLRPACWFKARF